MMKFWKWFPLSPLGLLNFFVLQWFKFRLALVREDTKNRVIGFKFLTYVKPMTGWWNNYDYYPSHDEWIPLTILVSEWTISERK